MYACVCVCVKIENKVDAVNEYSRFRFLFL